MMNNVRGTQDFLDMRLFNTVVEIVRKRLSCAHFHEISTPILEHTELFKRSLGLETDVVSKQMFVIKTEDEDSLCLRPEATASTMRAFLQQPPMQLPWKVFSWGPMFRYERPQKGRFRQFHQLTVEMIGASSIYYDILLIAMLDDLFQHALFLENYALIVNFLGCADDRRIFKEKLYHFLTTVSAVLCATCLERKEKNILRVFDCKQEQCKQQYIKAPQLTAALCQSCAAEWTQLQQGLDLLSVSYTVMPTLVRGLDYYNKTVFEFVSADLGAQSAFCGGGRYDQLAIMLGSKTDYPSLGAAIGLERLLLLVEPIKDKLPLPKEPAIQVIIPLAPEQYSLALLLVDELHAHGLCADALFETSSLKSMMRKANTMGAQHVILVGSEEQQQGMVTVKNMMTGSEEKIKQTDIVKYLMP